MRFINLVNFFLLLFIFSIARFNIGIGQVLGVSNEKITVDTINEKIAISTVTAFSQKEITEEEIIPFQTIYEPTADLEYGEERVLQVGKNGTRYNTYLITHWFDEEINRKLLVTKVDEPTDERVSVGKKIVWRKISTPEGEIKYWRRMRVFATKYDHKCLGCDYYTSIGAYLQKGVCAVDPKVIKYHTHFYVPGYGMCAALDTGGLIKGNRIDLAYEDASKASWGAGYVDIYLIDNVPEDAIK